MARRSENRGRREGRVPNAPAASRAERKKHTSVVTTGSPEQPAFPAQWFYGLLRALPGDRAFLPPSPALPLADLTPASGRQNHTTSPYASGRARLARCRVHRIPPRVRDDREPPLDWDETARISERIWLRREAKYFCKRGWTRYFGKHGLICPSGKICRCRSRSLSYGGEVAPRIDGKRASFSTSSSPRKRGPIRRGFSAFDTVADGFRYNKLRWLWVPAFAGTTHNVAGRSHRPTSRSAKYAMVLR
jgi:hypothetical protein